MKHNIFKIRKLQQIGVKEPSEVGAVNHNKKTTELENMGSSINNLNSRMADIMSMFEQFMKVSLSKQGKVDGQEESFPQAKQIEVRDRYVHIELPEGTQGKLSSVQIEKWTTDLCMHVFSTSFHYYLSEQMTFEQVKVFGSESILRNILKLTERFKLTSAELEIINNHIGEKILDYLQKKYPLTQSNDVNKALEKEVKESDNLDLLENDFLYENDIIFKYRDDGNYNDMIMKVLNKAMEQIDATSLYFQSLQASNSPENENPTNYNDFQAYMSELFESVFDIEGLNMSNGGEQKMQKKNSFGKSAHFNKQKQVQRIKEYTHYQIGRKISQNTRLYTQEEINSKNLVIKDTAILRILTKWCEELWHKFSKENYYPQRSESIQLQDPQYVNPFFKWMKNSINVKIITEKENIITFKKDLDKNIFNEQAFFLLKNLEDDQINYIPSLEKASGKFAEQTVKNLYSYITLYLNRLIHGLLKVAKEFHEKQIDKSWTDWPSPAHLISFKVGDLMRCKVSSKQKEIVKIFKQIKHLSSTAPEKMKIVRIKDRLKKGTNDILINVKFNNRIICEIQLQVINKTKSKFIQCSNSFSHYIYEIRRSIFGPLSQLCNVWHNFEPRSSQYEDMIKMKRKSIGGQNNPCLNGEEHAYINFNLPFQCSSCLNLYYHNNYFINNQKCSKCADYKCARCEIDSLEETKLKKIIFPNRKDASLLKSCRKWEDKTKLPDVGCCVKIESDIIKVEVFKSMNIQGKFWLLGQKNGGIYNVKRINNKEDIQSFLQAYYIFEIFQAKETFIKINENQAKIFTVKQHYKKNLKEQKEALILTQIRLKQQQMYELIKGQPELQKSKKNLKRLEFASNYLKDISYFNVFENLTALNLDYNYIEDLKEVSKFKQLQKLQINNNQRLVDFSPEICSLQELSSFKINSCTIKELPMEFGNFKSLTQFEIDGNKLQALPQSLCDILSLEELSFSKNQLKKMPENMGKLINLRRLWIQSNQLQSIPQSFNKLSNLIHLDLSFNRLEILPNVFQGLNKLQILKLGGNKLIELPVSIGELESLKILKLLKNKLTSLPDNLQKCKLLEQIDISTNTISVIPQSLAKCPKLQTMIVNDNKLLEIPDWFSRLKQKKIDLNNNCLMSFPSFIFEMQINLQEINISKNEIEEIPERIMELQCLSTLKIFNNKIKILPEALFTLPKLTDLMCKDNYITKIPSSYTLGCSVAKKNPPINLFERNKIEDVTDFHDFMKESISLTYNSLKKIPLNPLHKATLHTIYLPFNSIQQIPREIKEYKAIKALNLTNNQLEIIPKELGQLELIGANKLCLEQNPIKEVECRDFCLAKGTTKTKQLVETAKPQGTNDKIDEMKPGKLADIDSSSDEQN